MSTRTRHSRRGRQRSGKAAATSDARTPRTDKPTADKPPRGAPTAAKPTTGAPPTGGVLAPVKRVLGGVKGAVITAGALAVAVSAIIALVPKGSPPPATLGASFIPPIQVYPNTTLDEYAARVRGSTTASVTTPGGVRGRTTASVATLGGFRGSAASVTTLSGGRLPSYRLAADVTQVVTTSDSTGSSDSLGAGSATSTSTTDTETTTATATDTTSTTSTSSSCTEPSAPSGTTTSATTSATCASPTLNLGVTRAGTGLHLLGSAPDVQSVAQQIQLVPRCPAGTHEDAPGGGCVPNSTLTCPPTGCVVTEPDTYDPGPSCTANVTAGRCGAAALIAKAQSGGVEPEAAARKVVALFAASRGEVTGHTVHPLGVMITFEADLVGFVGTRATIRWSIFSADPAHPLANGWYRTVPIMTITPDSTDDRFSSQFWVPEPRRRGDYFVRLEVDSADGLTRTYSDSPHFH